MLLRGKLLRVTNAFAEFGWPPRLWCDPDDVQARYRELAPTRHPDHCQGHQEPLRNLNQARSILLSHPARIQHFLALRSGQHELTAPFQPDFDSFAHVANLCQQAAQLPPNSPPEKLLAELKATTTEIEKKLHDLDDSLRALSATPAPPSARLLPIAEEYQFLLRWKKSLHEARTSLLLR